MTDLAKFDVQYWKEVRTAEQGDFGPLIARLREGVMPTIMDLGRFADLFERRRPAHRPKNAQTATARLEAVVTPRALAAESYRRIMRWLNDHGGKYRMSDAVDFHVCRQFELGSPTAFKTWRKNQDAPK